MSIPLQSASAASSAANEVRIGSIQAAKSAGLIYVAGDEPGIVRQRRGSGFAYRDPHGQPVKADDELSRIKALAIPPAWESVWICARAQGHLQATGRDSKGRKQYIYHENYREARDFTKFNHLIRFGSVLPRIRRSVARDLSTSGMPKRKAIALIVRLMDETCVRVGNEEYARKNHSYGLTTLRNEHLNIRGAEIRLKFRAKSGVAQEILLSDMRLAQVLNEVRSIRGSNVFQYFDQDGQAHSVRSVDVNDYLRQRAGQKISAKDFRTWHGTVQTLMGLWQAGPGNSPTEARRLLSVAIKKTAARLGNRPAVCRGYYVHPEVLDGYVNRTLFKKLQKEPVPRHRRGYEDVLLAIVKKLHQPRTAS